MRATWPALQDLWPHSQQVPSDACSQVFRMLVYVGHVLAKTALQLLLQWVV